MSTTELPRYDFHIHTTYLKCANASMEVAAIVDECERLGVTKLGFTDHLNIIDKLDCHLPIRKDIEALDTKIDVYFGAELSFLGCDGDFAFSEEIQERLGFQFAIGGIHSGYLKEYDLKKLIDNQHRHHLKVCADPLVDVLVHPYWFNWKEFERNNWPWFDSMSPVPTSYARELGQAARETGTAIEINGSSNLKHPKLSERYVAEYVEFLSAVAEEGACFSLASDAHDIGQLKNAESARLVAEKINLTPERIYIPKCAPINKR